MFTSWWQKIEGNSLIACPDIAITPMNRPIHLQYANERLLSDLELARCCIYDLELPVEAIRWNMLLGTSSRSYPRAVEAGDRFLERAVAPCIGKPRGQISIPKKLN